MISSLHRSFLLLSCTLLVAGAVPYIPFKYPLFKQCDPRWGNDFMGGNSSKTDTVCDQGCAMSCLSMGLNGKGYKLPDGSAEINPGTMNHWLRTTGGYVCVDGDCNNLVLNHPDLISPHIRFLNESEKPSAATMQKWVVAQNPIGLLHVRNKHHFVLLTGYDTESDDVFYVNDPFYSQTSYQWSDVADIITYSVSRS